MKITNKFHLPEPLVKAVENDPYDSGDSDISVTRLIDSPQILQLMKHHHGEMEEDVSERIWALLGQSVHSVIERAAREGDIVEERFFAAVRGWKVSGQVDLVSKGILYDFKVTSVWSLKGDAKIEYERQLNVLDWLLWKNGIEVKELKICGICKDWRRNELKRFGGDYPPAPAVLVDVPRWTRGQQEEYVSDRVLRHQEAAVGNIPDCSPDERWEKPTTYAVMKKGRKSALRVFESFEEADKYAGNDDKLEIVERPGASVRCEEYCPVREWCSQRLDK